ncbi:MAG: TetR/AcrR family transcriptional regulator, partial [Leptospira sp.]|nr:TetR/AcrR family transcriptional regulator [Leptospira sp.]
QDMGISKKTLYKFFETKDKLIEAAIEHMMKKIKAEFDKIINDHKRNSIDRLNEIFFTVAKFGAKISKDAMRDVTKHRPDLIQKMLEFRGERIKSLAAVIKDGQDRGEIRKDIDPELTIEVFLAAVNTIMVPNYLVNSPHTFDGAFKNIFSVFLMGIEQKQTAN